MTKIGNVSSEPRNSPLFDELERLNNNQQVTDDLISELVSKVQSVSRVQLSKCGTGDGEDVDAEQWHPPLRTELIKRAERQLDLNSRLRAVIDSIEL